MAVRALLDKHDFAVTGFEFGDLLAAGNTLES